MSKLWAAVVFLVYFGFTVTLLYVSGAFQSGFDHHPDEPAHFVTGLMLRDYVAQGFPATPMAFAANFYLHYPEVAFGHWPPVFYLLQAGWTLLFPPNHTSLLLLMALLTSCTACILCRTAAQHFSRTLAVLAGLTFIALPLTQQYASEIMIEAPSVLVGLIAALAVAAVLDRSTWRSAAWFGIAASVAILTKSSGWSLALTPVIAMPLSGRWKIPTIARFIHSGGIVAALCLPFYIWTRRMALAGTEGKPMSVRHMAEALMQLTGFLPDLLGVVLLLLAACGLFLKVILPLRNASVQTFWAAMAAYLVSVIVFHAIAPTVAEPRKIVMTMPVLLLFSFAALDWFARKRPWMANGIALAVLAFFTVRTFYAAPQPADAFAEPVQHVLSHAPLRQAITLISSNRPGGEGALIAEFAQRDPTPLRILLRATKFLSSSTWNGLNYTLRYRTPEAVLTALEDLPVQIVVVHTSPGPGYAHHDLLVQALRQYTPNWLLIFTSPKSQREQFEIYLLTKNIPSAPGKIQIDLRDKLNKILEYQLPRQPAR
ncbi:MAG TPA: glycosyltransferase family 39 protein [Bryobacteraceae bacterium]